MNDQRIRFRINTVLANGEVRHPALQASIPAHLFYVVLSALESARESCSPIDYRALDGLIDALTESRGK